MTYTLDNERWKTDGDCSKCRRAKYCSKDCTARKRRMRAFISEAIVKATGIDRIREAMHGKQYE